MALLLGLGASILVPASAQAAPACVAVTSQAVYRGLGYDHIVHLASHCSSSATCSVSTDVNPEPIVVTVAPKEEVDVLTFRGSPARVFDAHVTCQVAK
jgi:hypothetical protein